MNGRLFVWLLIFAASVTGCGRSASFFRITDPHWKADSIEFSLRQTDSVAGREHPQSLDVSCLNCNLVEASTEVIVDSTGNARVNIPEANYLLSALLHISGRGIDTVLQLKQRSIKEAENFYKLSHPLIGRILVTQFSILYADSAMSQIATHAEKGDELNLFGENDLLFFAHHPLFPAPVYLPKTSGVRLY